jgi:hypothetical protein
MKFTEYQYRVTTALGAKQEGLTIVHFLNKLIEIDQKCR